MARRSPDFRQELTGKLKHVKHAEVILGQMQQFDPGMNFDLFRQNPDGTVIKWTGIDRKNFVRGVEIVRKAIEADLKKHPSSSLLFETFLPKLPDLNSVRHTLTAAFSRVIRMS
jgi:hypothetical protein